MTYACIDNKPKRISYVNIFLVSFSDCLIPRIYKTFSLPSANIYKFSTKSNWPNWKIPLQKKNLCIVLWIPNKATKFSERARPLIMIYGAYMSYIAHHQWVHSLRESSHITTYKTWRHFGCSFFFYLSTFSFTLVLFCSFLPYRCSMDCKHIYEKKVITQYIKSKQGRAQCPMTGILNYTNPSLI